MIFVLSFLSVLSCLSAEDHFLSYIIPCYNCESTIEETVESIYSQNLKCPFEIICTDDQSNDGTYQKLIQLSKHHPEIQIFQHSQNKGGGATRNTCVVHSKGDLIFCLDSDNILEPNTVQKLIDHMDQTKSDIVSVETMIYFEGNFHKKGFIQYKSNNQQYFFDNVLKDENTPPWSGNYLYTRRSFDHVGGYPENFGALDTFTFGFLQLLNQLKMTYALNTCYWHRTGHSSYYIRNSKGGALNIKFFSFMLLHRDLFEQETIRLLEKHLQLAKSRRPYNDYIWFLKEAKLVLK